MKRIFVLLTAALVSACGVFQPYEAAETTEQRAYAVSKSYNVLLESARDIVVNEALPADLRRAVQAVEARTTPVIDELDKAVVAYTVERAKFAQAKTTAEKLDVVSLNLERWLMKAEEALADLAVAVEGE